MEYIGEANIRTYLAPDRCLDRSFIGLGWGLIYTRLLGFCHSQVVPTLSILPESPGTEAAVGQFSRYLPGIVDDGELGFVLELLGLLKLGVVALLRAQLLHEGLVRGLGEPALLVQQGQHTWRVVLQRARRAGSEQGRPGLRLPRESRPPTHTHKQPPSSITATAYI